MQTPVPSKKKRATRSSGRSWPHIYKRTHPSGQVSWVVDFGEQNGKRNRKAFATREDADVEAEKARVARRELGQAAFSLPDKIRHQAAECMKMLEPYQADLIEACRYYVEHVLKFRQAPTVREIIEQIIDQKVKNRRRADTIEELKYRLGSFAKTFGDRKLADIGQEELEGWLNKPNWSTQTRDHYMTKIGMVYNFAMKRRQPWVDRNLIKYIERPTVENKPAEVFTVNECLNLLTYAGHHGLLPYCVLGLFCGLRPREINRLTWDKVKLTERSLIVEGLGAKTRARRVVTINDTALAWLSSCVQQSGMILGFKDQKLNQLQKNLAKAIGLRAWKQDGLRHSFGSYLLALSNDENMVANQMGNSPTMIHRHYKALVTEAEAKRFWALRPSAATNIIPITAATA